MYHGDVHPRLLKHRAVLHDAGDAASALLNTSRQQYVPGQDISATAFISPGRQYCPTPSCQSGACRACPPGARRAKMLYYKKHHCSGTPMMPPGSRISELHGNISCQAGQYGMPKVPGSILTVIKSLFQIRKLASGPHGR